MRILPGIAGWLGDVNAFDALGTVGVLGYVGAYLALQLGFLKGDGYVFPALNLVASLAILVSLTRDYNAYSVTIEICWAAISIIGITRIYVVSRYIRLSAEEAEVARRIVPSLKKDAVRRLLRIGRFADVADGHVLTVQGEPVRDIAMVMSGICHIDRGGRLIASVSAGALIGEMTLSTGGPATATVRTAGPARLFLIDRAALVAFLQRNPEAMADVERSVAGDLRLKLAETSTRLSNAMGDQGASPP